MVFGKAFSRSSYPNPGVFDNVTVIPPYVRTVALVTNPLPSITKCENPGMVVRFVSAPRRFMSSHKTTAPGPFVS